MKDALSPPSSLRFYVSPDCKIFLFSLYHFTYYSRTNSKGQKHERCTTNSLESNNFQGQSQREAFSRHSFSHADCSHSTVLNDGGPYLSSSLSVCDVMMFVSLPVLGGPRWTMPWNGFRQKEVDKEERRTHFVTETEEKDVLSVSQPHSQKKVLFSARHCLSERM